MSLPPEAGAVVGYAASIGIKVAQRAIQGHGSFPESLRDYLYLHNANKQNAI